MPLDVEEHLGLRVGQLQLERALPEDRPEGGGDHGLQQLEEPPRVVVEGGRGDRPSHGGW
jgi:hypothetical protein